MTFEKEHSCVWSVAAGISQKMPQSWREQACKMQCHPCFTQDPFWQHKCYPAPLSRSFLAFDLILLAWITVSLHCRYVFTLGVLLFYLKGILMLLPLCLYLCVYIQSSVNWEGQFYTGLANMPSNSQSTLPDAFIAFNSIDLSWWCSAHHDVGPGFGNLTNTQRTSRHKVVPWDHFFQAMALPTPSSSPRTGARAYGREHLPASFPMATAGWRGIFPGFPDEWSLIAVGEGFASPAQCTTDSSWQPYEGGLRQPGHSYGRKSTNVTRLLYCWRMCLQIIISLIFVNVEDV